MTARYPAAPGEGFELSAGDVTVTSVAVRLRRYPRVSDGVLRIGDDLTAVQRLPRVLAVAAAAAHRGASAAGRSASISGQPHDTSRCEDDAEGLVAAVEVRAQASTERLQLGELMLQLFELRAQEVPDLDAAVRAAGNVGAHQDRDLGQRHAEPLRLPDEPDPLRGGRRIETEAARRPVGTREQPEAFVVAQRVARQAGRGRQRADPQGAGPGRPPASC